MKLDEFKAWFEGFTESMEGPPSEKQWERIKDQVKEINGVAVSYPVYVDRYVYPHNRRYPYWEALGIGSVSTSKLSASLSAAPALSFNKTEDFDSVTAMYAAGKAEALAA